MPALLRPSSCGPVALLHCPSVPAVSFLIGVARVAPARLIASVVLWPRGLPTLSLRTDRLVFCSSVWLRFAPARLIASVVVWPRGLTPLSLCTDRLVFDRCGFVSLLPALSHPSSCGPVALLPCPTVPPSRFCSSVWLRFAPARLIVSVVLWPRGLPNLSLRTARFSPLVVSRPPVIFYIL